MKVLVTGANGFVGKALCEHLVHHGHEVTAAVRRAGSAPAGTLEILVADIGPDTDWTEALNGQDAVVHLAARVHVMDDDASDPLSEFRMVNSAGTRRLAEMSMAAGVTSFVNLSSIKANGEGRSTPYTVHDEPLPVDAYGISKLDAEHLTQAVALGTKAHVTSIRVPLVYGPAAGGNFRRLVTIARRGVPLPLASVQNRRTMISLWNLVDLIEHQLAPAAPGYELVIAGDAESMSTAELFRAIAHGLDRPARLVRFPVRWLEMAAKAARRGDEVQRLTGSLEVTNGSTRPGFSWEPPLSTEEGLRRTARHWTASDPTVLETEPTAPGTKRILLGVTIDESLQFLAEIPQALVADGWDVHVVSTPGERLAAMSAIPGVSVHPLDMRRDPSPRADLRSLVRWWRVVRSVRPDVSFVGTPKAGLLGMLSSWMFRVPSRVYLLRGLRLESSVGLYRRALWLMERLASGASTEVLAISPSLLARAQDLHIVGSRPIAVIGSGSSHGVDLDHFNVAHYSVEDRSHVRSLIGVSPEEFVVGFVGRVRTDKGVRELADAVAQLNPATPTKLVLIGRSEEDGIVELLRAGDRSEFITHVGHVQDVDRYYPAFDVLCLPSHREGFGNVVIEAAAMSVPAVVTDATGVRDTVVDGETGLIVPLGDVPALAAALRKMRDPHLASHMGARARDRAVTEFDEGVVNQRLLDHLNAAIRTVRGTA